MFFHPRPRTPCLSTENKMVCSSQILNMTANMAAQATHETTFLSTTKLLSGKKKLLELL